MGSHTILSCGSLNQLVGSGYKGSLQTHLSWLVLRERGAWQILRDCEGANYVKGLKKPSLRRTWQMGCVGCVCVYERACAHTLAPESQKRTSGTQIYHSVPYFLETDSLGEPRAGLEPTPVTLLPSTSTALELETCAHMPSLLPECQASLLTH